MPTPPTGTVAHYYDRNTRRFLRIGGSGASHAIHRQLWGPGVSTTEEAADFVNRLIVSAVHDLRSGPPGTFLDMGCGVGGSMVRLAEAFPESELHGITISREQREIGTRLVRRHGLHERCRIHHGDFQSADLGLSADVVFAVESFVHAASPAHFFAGVDTHLGADGHLLLADDFLASDYASLDPRGQRGVRDFRAGWRAPAVCTVEECASAASVVGLELLEDEDLTPLIRLGRPRDRAVSLVSPVVRGVGLARIPFFGNLVGGDALQAGLRAGRFTYRLLIFRRAP